MNYPLILPSVRHTTTAAIASYLAVYVLIKLLRNGFSAYRVSLIISFFFVFLLYFHQLFFPAETAYGTNKFVYLNFIFLLGFLVIPISLGDAKSLKFLAFGLFIVSVGFCLISILGQTSVENIRRSGLGLNPSIMSKICIIPAIYVGCQILTVRSSVKWWQLIIIVLSVAAIIKTGSRAVLILYLLSMIIMAAYISVSKSILRILLSIFVVLGSFILALQLELIPPQIAERFKMENWLPSAHQDEGDRLDIFGLALELILENPLGVGLGNFSSFHRFIVAPHNFILESTAELGWLAGILFIFLFAWIFIAYKRISRNADFGIHFLFMIYSNAILNSMVGGELTHQSFLIYMSAGILVVHLQRANLPKARAPLRRKKMNRRPEHV